MLQSLKSRSRTAHAIYPIPHGPGNSYQSNAARQFQPDGLWMGTNRHGPAAPLRHDNRRGPLDGFSHTYAGATLLALFSALTGKYLSEIGLFFLGLNRQWQVKIGWWVTVVSAFIGTYTHVLLDSIMHHDVEPFFPLTTMNPLQGFISIASLHNFCIYSGMAGGVVYFAILAVRKFNNSKRQDPAAGAR